MCEFKFTQALGRLGQVLWRAKWEYTTSKYTCKIKIKLHIKMCHMYPSDEKLLHQSPRPRDSLQGPPKSTPQTRTAQIQNESAYRSVSTVEQHSYAHTMKYIRGLLRMHKMSKLPAIITFFFLFFFLIRRRRRRVEAFVPPCSR